MVTNTIRCGLCSIVERHQFDYNFPWLELREVESTAASKGSFFLQAVDATAISLETLEIASVCQTDAAWG